MNHDKAANPTSSEPVNLQDRAPAEALLIANMSPLKARMIRRTSRGFSPAFWREGGVARMQASPRINEVRRTGTRKTKMNRQPMVVETSPPKVGPTAGPMAVIRVPTPIMVPMRRAGTSSRMMLNMSGRAMLVPSPWTALPRSRIQK